MKKYSFKHLGFFLLFGLGLLACNSNIQPEQIKNDIDGAIESFLPLAIHSQIDSSTNKSQLIQGWNLVAKTLDEQLIPLLKGDKLKVQDIKDWLVTFNKSDLPLSDDEIGILQATIDLILRHLPTEDFSNLLNQNSITATAKDFLVSAFESARDAINLALTKYPTQTKEFPTTAALIPKATHVKELKFEIAFRGRK